MPHHHYLSIIQFINEQYLLNIKDEVTCEKIYILNLIYFFLIHKYYAESVRLRDKINILTDMLNCIKLPHYALI